MQWRRQGALGHVPLRLPTISFLVHFVVKLAATVEILCSLWDQLVQMSIHSSFDQYYISHKTVSHRAAAASGPEVRREFPFSQQILETPLLLWITAPPCCVLLVDIILTIKWCVV